MKLKWKYICDSFYLNIEDDCIYYFSPGITSQVKLYIIHQNELPKKSWAGNTLETLEDRLTTYLENIHQLNPYFGYGQHDILGEYP